MHKLKRALTLSGALMINLGAIIGAGIFVIIGLAAGAAGPAVIAAILLSALIALLTGLSFSEIARHSAKEGGVYEYAKEALSPFAGFAGGWLWTFGNIIALSAVALSLGSYADVLFHLSISTAYFALFILSAFMLLNILGIKNSAKTLSAFVAINVAVLAIFIVASMFSFHASHFANFFQDGFKGLMEGTVLIFFAFTGFSRVTTISEEIKDPERTIPRAIVLSILISTLLYVLVAIAALSLVPSHALAESTSPLSLAISVLRNPVLDILIAIGGITATSGVVLTGILGTSRVLFAMARDNELPRPLSYIDKFSTPFYSIIASSLLGMLFILFVSFGTIVETANASILLSYFIINIAALKLHLALMKKGAPRMGRMSEKRYFFIVPVLGALTIVSIIAYISPKSLLFMLAVLLIGIAYYLYKSFKSLKHVEAFISKEIPVRSIVREFGRSRARLRV